MQILFTNNNTVLSKAIRYLTHEESSHCAIRINDFVLHSTVFGPEIRTYEYFTKRNHVVASVPVHIDERKAIKLITTLDGNRYDYAALLYLGLRYALRRYCSLSIPKANLWNVSGMYLCTELVTKLLYGKPDALITPQQLLNKLTNNKG